MQQTYAGINSFPETPDLQTNGATMPSKHRATLSNEKPQALLQHLDAALLFLSFS